MIRGARTMRLKDRIRKAQKTLKARGKSSSPFLRLKLKLYLIIYRRKWLTHTIHTDFKDLNTLEKVEKITKKLLTTPLFVKCGVLNTYILGINAVWAATPHFEGYVHKRILSPFSTYSYDGFEEFILKRKIIDGDKEAVRELENRWGVSDSLEELKSILRE